MKNLKAMKKILTCCVQALSILVMVMICVGNAVGQGIEPNSSKLQEKIKPGSNKRWIEFKEGTPINPESIFTEMKEYLELSGDDEMKLVNTSSDELGFTHHDYQQHYKGIKIMGADYKVHRSSSGQSGSANGKIVPRLNTDVNPSITESEALKAALNYVNAQAYMWEDKEEEKQLKMDSKDPEATYFPKGELVFEKIRGKKEFVAENMELSWKFNIYDQAMEKAQTVFVSAKTGNVVNSLPLVHNCSSGSGNTTWYGNQIFHTHNDGGVFILEDQCHSSDYISSLKTRNDDDDDNYTDADNNWTETSAITTHWGMQRVLEYFFNDHDRRSWDGDGDGIKVKNNWEMDNAAYSPVVGPLGTIYSEAIKIGNNFTPSNPNDDWNTLDILGHEFTHGLDQHEGELRYQDESGALDESFADIFGELVENEFRPADWVHGADRGLANRSFIAPNNPPNMEYPQPDTYGGTNWYDYSTGNWDYGGVHINSGVQNFWFYLLVNGGSGTNDKGTDYDVTAIPIESAAKIVYRNLTEYMTSSSDYLDAREGSIRAAIDLFGSCSEEVIQVGNAWDAVGVAGISNKYENFVCGTYPSSETTEQGIAAVHAAKDADGSSCLATITPSTTLVYFVASKEVILYPGFTAESGSNFLAFIKPCAISNYKFMPGSDRVDDATNSDDISEIENSAEELTAIVSPNPFSSNFEVSLTVNQDERARLVLYNSLGARIKTLMETQVSSGMNKFTFDGSDLTPGVYLVEVSHGSSKSVKRIVKM